MDRDDLEPCHRVHEGEPGLQALLRGTNGETSSCNGRGSLEGSIARMELLARVDLLVNPGQPFLGPLGTIMV